MQGRGWHRDGEAGPSWRTTELDEVECRGGEPREGGPADASNEDAGETTRAWRLLGRRMACCWCNRPGDGEGGRDASEPAWPGRRAGRVGKTRRRAGTTTGVRAPAAALASRLTGSQLACSGRAGRSRDRSAVMNRVQHTGWWAAREKLGQNAPNAPPHALLPWRPINPRRPPEVRTGQAGQPVASCWTEGRRGRGDAHSENGQGAASGDALSSPPPSALRDEGNAQIVSSVSRQAGACPSRGF